MCNPNLCSFFQFCVALRYFATGADYLAIGDCHGVSKPTVCRAVRDVSNFFHKNLTDYVHWPDHVTEKTNKSVVFYRERKQKPGCFGLIDGTHVPICCPRGMGVDENQYYCYKGYYSINTMVSFNLLHTIEQNYEYINRNKKWKINTLDVTQTQSYIIKKNKQLHVH